MSGTARLQPPTFLSAIGKSYLRALLLPTPLWVMMYVTNRCNFRCKYCHVVDNAQKDPDFETLAARIDKVKQLGCNAITLMGGEPTLRRDIGAIIGYCTKRQILTTMPTNGTLLLKKRNGRTVLEELVASGLGNLLLSLDSLKPNFGASEKDVSNAEGILNAVLDQRTRAGLGVNVNMVITRQNIDQVPQMVEYCHARKLMLSAGFVQRGDMLHDSIYEADVHFTKNDMMAIRKVTAYLRGKLREGYRLAESIDYYNQVDKWIVNESNWKCDAGKHYLVLNAKGQVGLCGYLPFTDTNILDLDRDYLALTAPCRAKYHPTCVSKCMSSCHYMSASYRRYPIRNAARAMRNL